MSDFKRGLLQGLRLCFLQGVRVGPVRRLSGFSRSLGHREPEAYGERENAFIAQVGAEEVSQVGEELLQRIRSEYGYKRRELTSTVLEGSVSVSCPDFELRIWVEQDEDVVGQYRRNVEVASLKGFDVFSDARFHQVFTQYCNRLVLEMDGRLDMAGVVDCIEDIENLSAQLSYAPDLSWATLQFINPLLEIRIEPSSIVFQNGPGETLAALIEGSMSVLSLMGDPQGGELPA